MFLCVLQALPLGLAILGEHLYWIDRNKELVERVHARTGEGLVRVHSRASKLSALVASEPLSDPDACSLAECSHLCVADGTESSYRCSCPQGLVLDTDMKKCKEPPEFCDENEFTCKSGTINNCIPKVRK